MSPDHPTREYVPFIDWLKCLGMLIIVYGHVAGWAPLATLPPIMSKQFGVALFMFTIGYALVRETRSRWRVAFNRLFEIYLFGLGLALILSVATYTRRCWEVPTSSSISSRPTRQPGTWARTCTSSCFGRSSLTDFV
jgi:peptidoglycan/LPS O-acetylase OafA/YrhL